MSFGKSRARMTGSDKMKVTFKDVAGADEAKQELLKKIASLEMKIRKEKQLNRKMELNAELKKIRKKMESLLGGGE